MSNATKYLIITAIIIFLILFTINNDSQIEKRVIKASFSVSNNPAFNVNPNELTFGIIPPNSSAHRNITITNNFDKPKTIHIRASGEITKYIIVSENNFILNPNESKNVTFSVYSTNLTEFREYSGKIIIISK